MTGTNEFTERHTVHMRIEHIIKGAVSDATGRKVPLYEQIKAVAIIMYELGFGIWDAHSNPKNE